MLDSILSIVDTRPMNSKGKILGKPFTTVSAVGVPIVTNRRIGRVDLASLAICFFFLQVQQS
ncbi:hypothetical protein E6H29_12100 [Candidatus Bathyarchaeota archaeon]|nr:MAG: hypothetical protein E6H29_12100 [Candidatus Bathyarchaeota archaeon]